jgi:hypothetical protein
MKLTLTMPLHILLLPLLISPFTTAQETNCIELQDPSCEPLETNITGTSPYPQRSSPNINPTNSLT